MSEERTKLISTSCSSPFVSEDAGKQWHWMMDWCFEKKYPPAQKWAWDLAKKAWAEFSKTNIELSHGDIA